MSRAYSEQQQKSNNISGNDDDKREEDDGLTRTISMETNNNAIQKQQQQVALSAPSNSIGATEAEEPLKAKISTSSNSSSSPSSSSSSPSSSSSSVADRADELIKEDELKRADDAQASGDANDEILNSSSSQASLKQSYKEHEDESSVATKKKSSSSSSSSSSSFTIIECGNKEQQPHKTTTTTTTPTPTPTPTTTKTTTTTSADRHQLVSVSNEPIPLEPIRVSQTQTQTVEVNYQKKLPLNSNHFIQDSNQLETSKQQQQQQQHNNNNNNNNNSKADFNKPKKQQHFSLATGSSANTHKTQQPLNPNHLQRLSYPQSLLLRRWPWLAIGICAMSSLLFGMILSALTVYFMHGVTDCSGLAALHVAPNPSRPIGLEPETAALLEGMAAGLLEGRGTYADSLAPAARSALTDRPKFQRLPGNVWPFHYELFIQPEISEPNFNFSGRVEIYLNVTEATSRIQLHSLDLEVDENDGVSLLEMADQGNNSSGSSSVKITSVSQDRQLQYLIVDLDTRLQVGREYLLKIQFTGILNDDLAGFYRIKYESQGTNETTWIAATQFQATDARRAFPCFDEPLYKATFSIQIKHRKNMTALSNMPIIDRKDSSDGLWVTDTFSKSHRMSTYLVAYAVTNFESRTLGNISVWTRPGFLHTAQYALETASKVLRYYEDFFGIEYPLPKMDMIALQDFNAGAMENWGLITYRETAMLYDENSSSLSNKQRVATVVAHELAHQWFGNLVTPKWWDDLWLNEGFASYVEYIGVDHIEPKWRMLDQFVIEEVQNVLRMDALPSTHQISIPVNDPGEISEIFDHISYAKGASIIRMMSHFLTEPIFKSGLRRYLRALKYNNAEQSDLWSHLTEAQRLAGVDASRAVDVEHVMNSWTLQTGFPIVTLTRRYDNSRRATLEQVRYQPHKIAAAASANGYKNSTSLTLEDEQKWEIPITYTWKSELNWEPATRLWMHQNHSGSELELLNSPDIPDSDWILLNVRQVGYYRVNYDQRNWKLLIEQLTRDHLKINPSNRAQILDDLFDLARCGAIDYRFALEATQYLRAEKDYMPWDVVLLAFSYIDDMLTRTPIYGEFKDYLLDLMRPYYARYKDLEWTNSKNINNTSISNNDVPEHYNMMNAIAWSCQVDRHCIERAKTHFSQWKSTGQNDIKPALRYTIYCAAIENGDKDDWDFLWKVYEKEQNASERDRIMRALGCSKEMWILARYLDWTFNKSNKSIRRQDGATVFRMIARNNYGRDLAFNFMRERWSTIKEYYGKTSFSLSNLIRSLSGSMNTQVELNQLVNFFDTVKHDIGNGKRSFQIAIEEVESNVNWRNRNYKVIESWLQEAKA